MDLLAEYASDSESSSSKCDGKECETVNSDKDFICGSCKTGVSCNVQKEFPLKRANPGGKTKGDCFMSKVFRHLYSTPKELLLKLASNELNKCN